MASTENNPTTRSSQHVTGVTAHVDSDLSRGSGEAHGRTSVRAGAEALLEAKDHFHFCPRCGVGRAAAAGANPYRCGACGFAFYFNTASAVAVFIEDGNGKVLFIRRGREPGRGKLALTGGFTDPRETGEEATRREIREELGLELAGLTFVGAWPNQYYAGGFLVHVLDIFFRAEAATTAMTLDAEEVGGVEWLDPGTVDPEEIAFPSMRQALGAYLRGRGAV